MICRDVLRLLNPYVDGEIDLVRHVDMEAHLAECAACAEQESNLRSLQTVISSPSLSYQAPAALRARIQRLAPPRSRGQRRPSVRFAATAAGILLLIGAAATVGMLWFEMGSSVDDRLAELVVAGHVRSLQVDHLTDVASSDQHTVKPWFRGKLDFAPHVSDLTPQGYPLSGGRLDYLADRPVAALVYYRGLHAINLFTWPAGNSADKTVRRSNRQGYHLRSWQRSGMTYWAISDLNDQEFDQFIHFVQEQAADSRR